jgi:hypothetical protein
MSYVGKRRVQILRTNENGPLEPGGEVINTADSLPEIRTFVFASGWTCGIASSGAETGACAAEKLATFAIKTPCEHGLAGLLWFESV